MHNAYCYQIIMTEESNWFYATAAYAYIDKVTLPQLRNC